MKRLSVFLLAFSLMLSVWSPAAHAADGPVLEISSGQVAPGGEVTLTVTVEDNPGVAACLVYIYYDTGVFTVDPAEDISAAGVFRSSGGLIGNTIALARQNGRYGGDPDKDGVLALWYNGSGLDTTGDGGVMTVTLHADPAAAGGSYAVELGYSQEDTCDETGADVVFATAGGTVTVTGGSGGTAPDTEPETPAPDTETPDPDDGEEDQAQPEPGEDEPALPDDPQPEAGPDSGTEDREPVQETPESVDSGASQPAAEGEMDPQLAPLYAVNPDLVGWLRLGGEGGFAAPVVQREGDNEYYLRHDFYGEEDNHGAVFLDYRNRIDPNSENLIIYGHNMNDGTWFNYLVNYQDPDFLRENPLITFNTLRGKGEYAVVSVFVAATLPQHGDDFDYHNKTAFPTPEAKQDFLDRIARRSLLDTGVEADLQDQLLTLSTCLYDFSGERLVVVARKLREGETAPLYQYALDRSQLITVPAAQAQFVADRMIAAEIKGILNFAPVPLKVPGGVFVDRIDIASSLEKLAYFADLA